MVMIVIPGDLDYRYDRRVDPGFLEGPGVDHVVRIVLNQGLAPDG